MPLRGALHLFAHLQPATETVDKDVRALHIRNTVLMKLFLVPTRHRTACRHGSQNKGAVPNTGNFPASWIVFDILWDGNDDLHDTGFASMSPTGSRPQWLPFRLGGFE